MLNFIWPIFIIISVLFSVMRGNISELNDSIFSSIESTMQLMITMVGTMCFWSGIMNVLEKTKIFHKLKKAISKVTKFIFSEIGENSKENEYISLNLLSNLLGLGNAATPMGIKAMEEMEEKNENKNKLSKNMMLFILVNTASIQILPTTVIAIRSSLNSKNPSKMILHVWIVSIVVFFFFIGIGKVLFKEEK